MPRKKKDPRRGRKGIGGLTLYQRAFLLTGQRFDFLLGPRDVLGLPFKDRAEKEAAWAVHREELIAECENAEHPWAFFEFEPGQTGGNGGALGGIGGHKWHSEYARPASEHPEFERIRASVAFDPSWIRTWTDVEAVKKGCYFDVDKALHAVGFFRLLRHRVGKWAGRIFDLLPWQKFDVVMPLFGWMGPDGYRRFDKGHIEIPKKNGKSMLCSGISLYLLVADSEPSAEVYNAAGEREQARIVFAAAQKMAKASPYLAPVIRWTDSKMRGDHDESGSLYRLLSADSKNKDGYNISGCVIDELHMQKDRTLWDVLVYGGDARTQCLFVAITTAGEYDPNSIGWEQHEYARRCLAGDGGIGRDISFFGYIRCLPVELKDRWQEPELWYRANPSLGITLDFDTFKSRAEEAQNQTSKLNSFLRYRMNMWTQNKVAAFSIQIWNRGAVPGEGLERLRFLEEMARGRECFGGLDLASVNDLCAASLWFPPANYNPPQEALGVIDNGQLTMDNEEKRRSDGGGATGDSATSREDQEEEAVQPRGPLTEADVEGMHIWLPYLWLPEENILELQHQHNAPYTLWRDEGWMRLTPGAVADYNRIRRDICELDAEWSPGRWNYDKWSATQLTTQLREQDGIDMVEFGQGFGWMSGPTSELDRLMRLGLIAHPANPALDWMIGNCQFAEDHEGRRKLIKSDKKQKYKIDGPVSGVMGLDGAIRLAGIGGVLTADSVYTG